MPKIPYPVKRRYNLCYLARKKGYTIKTAIKTMLRGRNIDAGLEKQLSAYGFHVQLNLFTDGRIKKTTPTKLRQLYRFHERTRPAATNG